MRRRMGFLGVCYYTPSVVDSKFARRTGHTSRSKPDPSQFEPTPPVVIRLLSILQVTPHLRGSLESKEQEKNADSPFI
jgi:hypothetical protein